METSHQHKEPEPVTVLPWEWCSCELQGVALCCSAEALEVGFGSVTASLREGLGGETGEKWQVRFSNVPVTKNLLIGPV